MSKTTREDVVLECPKCGAEVPQHFVKEWNMTGRGDVKTRIEQRKCSACRRKWRRGVQIA